MNLKKTVAKVFVISMLAIACSMILVTALPGTGQPGSYVDEHIRRVIIDDDARLSAMLAHEVDADGVPRPVDIPTLMDAGFTIPNEPRIGYGMCMMNNRLYPYDDIAIRKAVIRLTDKETIIETLYTIYVGGVAIKLLDVAPYWLPPGQAGWINYDRPLPTYDPDAADAILLAAGYEDTDEDGILNMGEPEDPGCYGNMPTFTYTTIAPEESPLAFEMSVMICDELNAHGIPAELEPLTFNGMVIRLIFPPLDDWQMMTGIGIVWGLHETIVYDFFESTQEPLWNCWGVRDEVLASEDAEVMSWVTAGKHTPAVDESRLDWWAHELKLTLDPDWVTFVTKKIQELAALLEPYNPLTLTMTYTAWTGAYGTQPGTIGIVNHAGYGALANYNAWATLFARREKADGTVMNPRIWTMPQYVNTLNPLMADTVYDWDVLAPVTGGDMDLTPYYQEYVWDLVDGVPAQVPEDFAVGMVKQHPPTETQYTSGWTNPDNAFVSDDVYTTALSDGAYVEYEDFLFPAFLDNIPLWDIKKVEVGIEGYGDGDDYIEIEVSIDGKETWCPDPPATHIPPTEDLDHKLYVDVTECGTWTWAELSNIAVKLTKRSVDTENTIFVDLVGVRVSVAPAGFNFGDIATGMYVDYTLRAGMEWQDGTPITSEDIIFALNLLRFQDNIRYRAIWDKIYKIEKVSDLRVKVWYVDRYVYHFEEIGVFCYAPKHIWESYIGPDTELFYDPEQEAYYEFWIGWDRHHSEWRGWENKRGAMTDVGYPDEFWTDLIGTGPFYYPYGGWEPGVSARMLANREYVGSRICRGDVDVNGICDMRDVFQVLYRFGATPGLARWEEELYSMQGPAADIAPPCQSIGSEEVTVLRKHFGHKWRIDGKPVLPPPCD